MRPLVSGGLHWIDLSIEIQIDDAAIETAKSLRVQSLKTAEEETVFNLGRNGRMQLAMSTVIVDGKSPLPQSIKNPWRLAF